MVFVINTGVANCEPRRLCDGSKRGINRLPPETTVCPIPRRVVRADDERFPRSEHIPPDAFGDAPLRGFGQRFASDENRPRRGSPDHAFRSRPIRLEFSGEDGWRVFGPCVGSGQTTGGRHAAPPRKAVSASSARHSRKPGVPASQRGSRAAAAAGPTPGTSPRPAP